MGRCQIKRQRVDDLLAIKTVNLRKGFNERLAAVLNSLYYDNHILLALLSAVLILSCSFFNLIPFPL